MAGLCRNLLLWAWCVAGFAQTDGAAVFQKHCGSCHGKSAHGGRAPDLTRTALTSGDRDEDLFRTISKGVEGTEMEAYGERLRAEDIRGVIAFLRDSGRDRTPLSGDAANGKAIFWGKGGCANCHAVGDRGNRIGPDLSRIGRRRGAEYLRESLLAPSADITPEYGGVTVTLRDGKKIRGVERALDDFSAVLQDFSGKVYSFDRTSVRSATRDAESLMPTYGKQLSANELNDVVVYLSTLEVKP
uniref:Putative heme-binding protein n=1 Tax=Solibacter usitatus (strain Ellin6076) TaxID=234267 RepID=Q022J9_SOLUE